MFLKMFDKLFDLVQTDQMKNAIEQVEDERHFDSDVLGFLQLESLSELTEKSEMRTRTLEERTAEMRQIHEAISNSFPGHPNVHDINKIPGLKNNFVNKVGDCNISNTYEIISRKISILFSYVINHIFTPFIQKNQKTYFNKILLKIYGRNFYNM